MHSNQDKQCGIFCLSPCGLKVAHLSKSHALPFLVNAHPRSFYIFLKLSAMPIFICREILGWIEASVTRYRRWCTLAFLTKAGFRHLQETAEKLICRQHLRQQPTGTSAVYPLVHADTGSICPPSSIVGAERIRVSTGWAHAVSRQSVLSHRYNVVFIAQSCSRDRTESS